MILTTFAPEHQLGRELFVGRVETRVTRQHLIVFSVRERRNRACARLALSLHCSPSPAMPQSGSCVVVVGRCFSSSLQFL